VTSFFQLYGTPVVAVAGRMRNRTAIVMMKRPYSWHHVSQKQKVGSLATTRIRFETSLQ